MVFFICRPGKCRPGEVPRKMARNFTSVRTPGFGAYLRGIDNHGRRITMVRAISYMIGWERASGG